MASYAPSSLSASLVCSLGGFSIRPFRPDAGNRHSTQPESFAPSPQLLQILLFSCLYISMSCLWFIVCRIFSSLTSFPSLFLFMCAHGFILSVAFVCICICRQHALFHATFLIIPLFFALHRTFGLDVCPLPFFWSLESVSAPRLGLE